MCHVFFAVWCCFKRYEKYELFENLIFLDKLEQAICEILIKITVVSQPKIQNRDTQRRFPPKCIENTF